MYIAFLSTSVYGVCVYLSIFDLSDELDAYPVLLSHSPSRHVLTE